MDEKQLWDRFRETGDPREYLAFCDARAAGTVS